MKTRLHAEGSAPAPGAVFRALAENSGDCRTRGGPWMEVGTARCAVAARVSAGGPNVVSRALAVVWFRRLTLRSAMGTAQRTVPTWGSAPAPGAVFRALVENLRDSRTRGRVRLHPGRVCSPDGLPPERRSVTSLQPPLCRAKVLTMASVLLARTSKAGCKPALRFGSVPQVSQPAVSPISQSADCPWAGRASGAYRLRVGKPATQQTWKSAVQKSRVCSPERKVRNKP